MLTFMKRPSRFTMQYKVKHVEVKDENNARKRSAAATRNDTKVEAKRIRSDKLQRNIKNYFT